MSLNKNINKEKIIVVYEDICNLYDKSTLHHEGLNYHIEVHNLIISYGLIAGGFNGWHIRTTKDVVHAFKEYADMLCTLKVIIDNSIKPFMETNND